VYNIGCGICEDLKLESISEITETCSNKLVDLRLQALNIQACLTISFTLYLSRSWSIVTDFRGLRVSVVGWLGSRVVSVLDSGAEGPGFKSQPRRCRITVLGKPFTSIVPPFIKQQNW